jgi:hypothetical protein
MQNRHGLWTHLDAEISTRDHHAICLFQYRVQGSHRLGPFDLGDDR